MILEYHKRGWSGSDAFKVDGNLFSGNSKPDYKIDGKWSDKIYLTSTKNKDDKTCVFSKLPYHENCELMYGMSYFGLQLNYFPQRLKNVVAPTDTRRRTD